ncbi:hypothetical protein MP228_001244 [Amoeboaphelidium protococcarum]|nr:hypothetical protein MP228_001244 [Amoeboaphelidium protococcarum]
MKFIQLLSIAILFNCIKALNTEDFSVAVDDVTGSIYIALCGSVESINVALNSNLYDYSVTGLNLQSTDVSNLASGDIVLIKLQKGADGNSYSKVGQKTIAASSFVNTLRSPKLQIVNSNVFLMYIEQQLLSKVFMLKRYSSSSLSETWTGSVPAGSFSKINFVLDKASQLLVSVMYNDGFQIFSAEPSSLSITLRADRPTGALSYLDWRFCSFPKQQLSGTQYASVVEMVPSSSTATPNAQQFRLTSITVAANGDFSYQQRSLNLLTTQRDVVQFTLNDVASGSSIIGGLYTDLSFGNATPAVVYANTSHGIYRVQRLSSLSNSYFMMPSEDEDAYIVLGASAWPSQGDKIAAYNASTYELISFGSYNFPQSPFIGAASVRQNVQVFMSLPDAAQQSVSVNVLRVLPKVVTSTSTPPVTDTLTVQSTLSLSSQLNSSSLTTKQQSSFTPISVITEQLVSTSNALITQSSSNMQITSSSSNAQFTSSSSNAQTTSQSSNAQTTSSSSNAQTTSSSFSDPVVSNSMVSSAASFLISQSVSSASTASVSISSVNSFSLIYQTSITKTSSLSSTASQITYVTSSTNQVPYSFDLGLSISNHGLKSQFTTVMTTSTLGASNNTPQFSLQSLIQEYYVYAVLVGVALLIIVISCLVIAYRLRRKRYRKRKQLVMQAAAARSYENQQMSTLMIPQATTVTATSMTSAITAVSDQQEMSLPGYLMLTLNTDFTMSEKLGEGGFATVYKGQLLNPMCIQRAQEDVCAIKVFKPQPLSSPEAQIEEQQQFVQEVSMLSFFSNNKLFVKLVGFSTRPNTIVMKFYPFGNIEDVLTGRSSYAQWSQDLMFSLLIDVIEGLSEMHRQGFVHSDIKPANIMLGRDNGNAPFHAVISDFGIAQIVSNRALLVSAFQISKFQGLSVNYAAPELVARIINPQLAQEELPPQVKLSLDVYSVSIMGFEMICKQPAWNGREQNAVIEMIMSGSRPSWPQQIKDDKSPRMIALKSTIELGWDASSSRRPPIQNMFEQLSQFRLKQ